MLNYSDSTTFSLASEAVLYTILNNRIPSSYCGLTLNGSFRDGFSKLLGTLLKESKNCIMLEPVPARVLSLQPFKGPLVSKTGGRVLHGKVLALSLKNHNHFQLRCCLSLEYMKTKLSPF